MSKRKKIILELLIFSFGLFFVFFVVQAQSPGVGITLPTAAETGLSAKSLDQILSGFLGWLLLVAGMIALISFVVSGIMYLVSTGDENMIGRAKKSMLFSILGVVVVLAGYAIVKTIDSLMR